MSKGFMKTNLILLIAKIPSFIKTKRKCSLIPYKEDSNDYIYLKSKKKMSLQNYNFNCPNCYDKIIINLR
jgi:hypothetical protein